jgi:hypothetical protein
MNKKWNISLMVNEKEKRLLADAALSLGVSRSAILYRLVCFVLEGKITLLELSQKYTELQKRIVDEGEKRCLRIKIFSVTYLKFLQLVDEFGATPSVILKRLLLIYLYNAIDRKEIWDNP